MDIQNLNTRKKLQVAEDFYKEINNLFSNVINFTLFSEFVVDGCNIIKYIDKAKDKSHIGLKTNQEITNWIYFKIAK